MQFKEHEYLLLSRRGSVPLAVRARSKPHRERPEQARPQPVAASRRPVVKPGRLAALRDLRGAVRATWTAFGPGGQDL